MARARARSAPLDVPRLCGRATLLKHLWLALLRAVPWSRPRTVRAGSCARRWQPFGRARRWCNGREPAGPEQKRDEAPTRPRQARLTAKAAASSVLHHCFRFDLWPCSHGRGKGDRAVNASAEAVLEITLLQLFSPLRRVPHPMITAAVRSTTFPHGRSARSPRREAGGRKF